MIYTFEAFALDVLRRELKHRGELVAVEPLVLDILEFLIRNRHRVVSKDDLTAGVWGRRVASDSTLSSRIAAARDAIGDSGKEQRLIRTIPRHGFRFIGLVREEEVEPPSDSASSVQIESAPEPPAIAVLPFVHDLKADLQDAFVSGLAEDITTALGRFPWLSVIARSSSFMHRGWALDIRQVGRSLGAQYVLEGSIRGLSERLRVTARLIDTAAGTQLWSDQIDLSADDTFTPPDRVTERIVSILGQKLLRIEVERALHHPVGGTTARQCHIEGLGRLYRWNRDGISDALALFRRASEIDPEFAPAHAMGAYCFIQRKGYGWMTDRDGETAECTRLARRAGELARNDAAVLATAGHALAAITQDIESGAVLLEEALRLNPKLGLAWYVSGWIRLMVGDVSTAMQHLTRAVELSAFDPLLTKIEAGLAYAHFLAGRYDEACVMASRALRTRPSYLTAVRGAAVGHAFAGRVGEARRLIAFMQERDPSLRMSNVNQLLPMTAEHLDRFADALHKAGLPD